MLDLCVHELLVLSRPVLHLLEQVPVAVLKYDVDLWSILLFGSTGPILLSWRGILFMSIVVDQLFDFD